LNWIEHYKSATTPRVLPFGLPSIHGNGWRRHFSHHTTWSHWNYNLIWCPGSSTRPWPLLAMTSEKYWSRYPIQKLETNSKATIW